MPTAETANDTESPTLTCTGEGSTVTTVGTQFVVRVATPLIMSVQLETMHRKEAFESAWIVANFREGIEVPTLVQLETPLSLRCHCQASVPVPEAAMLKKAVSLTLTVVFDGWTEIAGGKQITSVAALL